MLFSTTILTGCSVFNSIKNSDVVQSVIPDKKPDAPKIAKTNFGRDLLGAGAPKYNIDDYIQAVEAIKISIPTGFLLDAFFPTANTPTKYAKIEKVLASGKTHLVRVHGLDNTCVRNNSCQRGTALLYGYNLAKVEQEARNAASNLTKLVCAQGQQVLAWKAKYKDAEFLYSPLLEQNLSRGSAEILLKNTAACVPGIRIVDNPVTGYAKIPGFLKECHESANGAPTAADCDIISFDGKDVRNADIVGWMAKHANKVAAYVWGTFDNGRLINEGKVVPAPMSRVNFPTRDMQFWAARILIPVQPKPALSPAAAAWCKAPGDMDSSHLYKNFSDDHGTGDGRANKPMMIVPQQYKSGIQIFDKNNVQVGSFGYYGAYDKGGYRYYTAIGSGDSSYTLGQKLEAKSGSEWALVKLPNDPKMCRWINAYRRGGVTR